MNRRVDPPSPLAWDGENLSWKEPRKYHFGGVISPPLIPSLEWLRFATDEEIFQQAVTRSVVVPWGVECEDCGATFYGEHVGKPCLACRSTHLLPLYSGRRSDIPG